MRPVQVVRDDDRAEMLVRQRPPVAFEIEPAGFDARVAGEQGKRSFVAVDGDNAVTSAGEVARVAAVAAGKVEHPGIGRDERRKALDPGRDLRRGRVRRRR